MQKFRRALRKNDQDLFDELIRQAKYHVQAGVMASNPNPVDSMLFAMLLEQQRMIRELQKQVQALLPKAERPHDDGNPRLSI